MTFINLYNTKLRDCLPLIKKSNKKDVVLCYYAQQEERLISEDVYWIEKNIGDIRYLSIWNVESTVSEE